MHRHKFARFAGYVLAPWFFLPLTFGGSTRDPGAGATASSGGPVLWHEPDNIESRDLFHGPGGPENGPRGPFVFLKEDTKGSSPKFDVRDQNGAVWRVKLGIEASPETAAARLLWAVGYSAIENYYLPELHVEDLPVRLHRGNKLIGPDGVMHNAELKLRNPSEKKAGSWGWRDTPFVNTRQFNGLRVMMALLNNWDLKDENNSIYQERQSDASAQPDTIYMVSDLGATFGSTGHSWPARKAKGNLASYGKSKFIRRQSAEYVDFNVPTRPALFYLVSLREFVARTHMRWIGKGIPRADAKWIGQLLARLSPDQIRDAFRAAGYSNGEVEGFTEIVLKRIGELNQL